MGYLLVRNNQSLRKLKSANFKVVLPKAIKKELAGNKKQEH